METIRNLSLKPFIPARRKLLHAMLSSPMLLAATPPSQADAGDARRMSGGSSLSLSLSVATLIAAPVYFLAEGGKLIITAIEPLAKGFAWVVRRIADGVSATLKFSGEIVTRAAISVGTALSVTATSVGWLLSAAGEVVCIVPNELGEKLIYNERIS